MGSFHSTSRGIEDPIFSFWFGDRIPRTSRLLPTCWDELLDWTNEASRIFETYVNRNNDEFQSTVTDKQHCAGEIHETHPLTAAPTESKSPTQDTPVTIRFVPLVLNDQVSALQNLHAMERFDQRGKFYAEHVIITMTSEHDQNLGVLSVGQFVHLYTILSRYADLMKLLPTGTSRHNDIKKKETQVCIICCKDEDEIRQDNDGDGKNNNNVMVILSPCSHELCSECYKRWVSRKYKCPFCRYDFSSQRAVRDTRTLNEHCTWQVLDDWNSIQDEGRKRPGSITELREELQTDIKRMERRLAQIWLTIQQQPTLSDSILGNYKTAGRTVPEFQDQGDLVVAVK